LRENLEDILIVLTFVSIDAKALYCRVWA